MMQAIAYKENGHPRLTWPAVTVREILDDNGIPTGESVSSDNLAALIAALPRGTEYALLAEAEAEAWWQATQPPEELAAARREEILARLAGIDASSVRPLRAMARGEDAQADQARLAALDAEAADLREELAALAI
jgi:hypothetical protein